MISSCGSLLLKPAYETEGCTLAPFPGWDRRKDGPNKQSSSNLLAWYEGARVRLEYICDGESKRR